MFERPIFIFVCWREDASAMSSPFTGMICRMTRFVVSIYTCTWQSQANASQQSGVGGAAGWPTGAHKGFNLTSVREGLLLNWRSASQSCLSVQLPCPFHKHRNWIWALNDAAEYALEWNSKNDDLQSWPVRSFLSSVGQSVRLSCLPRERTQQQDPGRGWNPLLARRRFKVAPRKCLTVCKQGAL